MASPLLLLRHILKACFRKKQMLLAPTVRGYVWRAQEGFAVSKRKMGPWSLLRSLLSTSLLPAPPKTHPAIPQLL